MTCPRRIRGLTLIELAVAMAALAMLVSLAMPHALGYLQRHRLKALAQEMSIDLSEARYQAARGGRALHLTVATGADWCYALTTAPLCDCRQAQPCQLKAVRAAQRPGLHLVEGHAARFDPAGAAMPGATAGVFTNVQGDRLRVDLLATGRARVCAPEGEFAQIPGC